MSDGVTPPPAPIVIALVDDYEVVLIGLAHMFDAYRDLIVIAEIDTNLPVTDDVDIVLYDSFAQPEADHDEINVLINNPHARRVVIYTWNFHPDLIASATTKGASGYLSKTLPARDLVTALQAVHAGQTVISTHATHTRPPTALDWPRLNRRPHRPRIQILALITQGKSNLEVAALTFLSINTIKSYIRSTYRKIGAHSRTQAVLWGMDTASNPTTAASTTRAADPDPPQPHQPTPTIPSNPPHHDKLATHTTHAIAIIALVIAIIVLLIILL